MLYKQLIDSIETTHHSLRKRAISSIKRTRPRLKNITERFLTTIIDCFENKRNVILL